MEDSCIGCGLCAKKCPVAAIEMQANKPVWVPKFAIQYGKKTKKHGQYVNPNVKV